MIIPIEKKVQLLSTRNSGNEKQVNKKYESKIDQLSLTILVYTAAQN